MQAFQSWVDIIIMAVLAVAYIITYIVQKNVIKGLKEVNSSHENLTSSQSSHIEAYKKLFNPSEIEQFVKLKTDTVKMEQQKEAVELRKELEDCKKVFNSASNDLFELSLFVYYFTDVFLKHKTIEERTAYINRNFKSAKMILNFYFPRIDIKTAENKKNQNQSPTS